MNRRKALRVHGPALFARRVPKACDTACTKGVSAHAAVMTSHPPCQGEAPHSSLGEGLLPGRGSRAAESSRRGGCESFGRPVVITDLQSFAPPIFPWELSGVTRSA